MFRKLCLILLLPLIVAGCQSQYSGTVVLEPEPAPLANAGFAPAPLPANTRILANWQITGNYMYPVTTCGSLVRLTTSRWTAPANAGTVTTEEAIRSGFLNAEGVRSLLQTAISRQLALTNSSININITSFTIDRKNAIVSTSIDTQTPVIRASVVYHVRYRGNTAQAIAAVAPDAGTAARYARLDWLP